LACQKLDSIFHATYDGYAVRAEVLNLLAGTTIRIDASLFNKDKVPDALRGERSLYHHAWEEHLGRIMATLATPTDRMLIVASELGTKRRRGAFHMAVQQAVAGTTQVKHRVAFWPNASDPCLWAADYCCWAIQRAHEQGDRVPRMQLARLIASERIYYP
jgi:hypothetical protein